MNELDVTLCGATNTRPTRAQHTRPAHAPVSRATRAHNTRSTGALALLGELGAVHAESRPADVRARDKDAALAAAQALPAA